MSVNLTPFHLSKLMDDDLQALRDSVSAEIMKREKQKRHDLDEVRREKKFEAWGFSAGTLDDIQKEKQRINKLNGMSLLAIPKIANRHPFSLTYFLPPLLAQDWSYLFSGGDAEPNYYVYAHVDPDVGPFSCPKIAGGSYKGIPFYIGKGTGKRAYDMKRNEGHGVALRQILASGKTAEDIVRIKFSGLTESKALEIESKLIYFFGTRFQNRQFGMLLNLDTPPIPKFVGEMSHISPKIYNNLTPPTVPGV